MPGHLEYTRESLGRLLCNCTGH